MCNCKNSIKSNCFQPVEKKSPCTNKCNRHICRPLYPGYTVLGSLSCDKCPKPYKRCPPCIKLPTGCPKPYNPCPTPCPTKRPICYPPRCVPYYTESIYWY
jgi:hypothetical protein